MVQKERMPAWSPRVPKYKIRQLYHQVALGIQDDELANKVGCAWMACCESFLEANQAVHGRAVCPVCGAVVPYKVKKGAWLKCRTCGWSLLWDEYFSTIRGK